MRVLKELLSEFLNDVIVNIDILADGYLSTAYKAVGERKTYVVRTNKGSIVGYEYPGDTETSYRISHLMQHNAFPVNNVKSYGTLEIDHITYHIQQYIAGTSKDITEYTEKDIIAAATLIGNIHKYGKDIAPENAVITYYRGRREYLGHHETILSLREQEERNSELYPRRRRLIEAFWNEYLNIAQQEDIYHRMTILHGDFWHNNILFDSSIPFLIDFSRIPYGDPGIDVGHFVANLETSYFLTKDEKYLVLKKLFLETYIDVTNDQEIEKYLMMSRLHVGYICVSNRIQQFIKREKHMIESYIDFLLAQANASTI